MEITYYEINESNAKRAQSMWSFNDYAEGSETSAYKKRVDEVYAIGEKAIEKGVQEEKVIRLCDRFAKQYADWINRGFAIEMQCPSVMITGASNFPVAKKNKQNAAREKHAALFDVIMGVKDRIYSMMNGTELIKAGDDDAVSRLEEKVEKLAADQAEMKKANAWHRKHRTMIGYEGLSHEEAVQTDKNIKAGYSWEQQPYPSYLLTNNNARLRNARNRLELLKAQKSKPTEQTKDNGVFRVVENTEIMRLQLCFDGKPEEDIRAVLKSNGFRWSPKNAAWQRQLTDNARRTVKRIEELLASPAKREERE